MSDKYLTWPDAFEISIVRMRVASPVHTHPHEWTTRASSDNLGWVEADCTRCGCSIIYPQEVKDPTEGALRVGVPLDCDEQVCAEVLSA